MLFFVVLDKDVFLHGTSSKNLRSLSSDELLNHVKKCQFLRIEKNAKMKTVSVIVLAQFCAAVLINTCAELTADKRERGRYDPGCYTG